jgi:hypothetical protein
MTGWTISGSRYFTNSLMLRGTFPMEIGGVVKTVSRSQRDEVCGEAAAF